MKHELEVGYCVVTEEYSHTRIEIVTHKLSEGYVLLDITPAMPKITGHLERYVKNNHSWAYSSTVHRFATDNPEYHAKFAELMHKIHDENSGRNS